MRLLCIFTSWKTAGAGAGLCFYPALRFPWLHPAVPGRLGTGWQGQEGSQRAGEVAERPPQRTLQLAAAVISTAGSRRGRAPEGFGRSPNPRRLRGRSPEKGRDGAGRREGWWHLPPPAATPSRGRATTAPGRRAGIPGAADGSGMVRLELLLFPHLGKVSTAIPAGMGAGGDIPCVGDHAVRRKCESRRDFCHF